MPQRPPAPDVSAPRARRDLAALLFLTLLASYAYFWQSRDWNTASRLMLTYSLVDRRQLEIDGLEQHTGDLARVGRHYYTDKAPGQSLIGALVYGPARAMDWLPEHPLYGAARAYWPTDYFVTLGTSGLFTALAGVVIYAFALRLGATHWGGVLLGLAYGLGSPAFVYATLFYGHQTSAFCLITSFFVLYRAAHEGRANVWNMLLSGLLAGYSVVVEYQTIGIAALLGLYAAGSIRRLQPVMTFAVAAAFAAALLAAYNYRAFGRVFELGYAHEVAAEFQAVHTATNPLGLRWPAGEQLREIVRQLFWGRYRGLAFYAPVLLAAPLGVLALLGKKHRGVVLVAVGSLASMLAVNVSYPLWAGGWCTGPRFLTPALPFMVLTVAGVLRAWQRGMFTTLVALATLAGSLLMLGCVAVGGRFPDARDPTDSLNDPIVSVVLPHWKGEMRGGPIAGGRQFEWNAGRWLIEHHWPVDQALPSEPSPHQAVQIAPLVAFWCVMAVVLMWRSRRPRLTNQNESTTKGAKHTKGKE
jgi:hypothetical protein